MSAAPSISAIQTHILNPDGNWGTSRLRLDSLPQTVTYITFCAHINPSDEGADDQPPTNHWSLFLVISPEASVRLDVVPGEPDAPAMLILDTKDYDVSELRSHEVSANVATGTTIKAILKIVVEKRRDCYTFAPIGEGCRFWMAKIAEDLAEAAVIPREKAQEAIQALGRYWKSSGGSESRVIREGKFF
jgi:hypothetical protein